MTSCHRAFSWLLRSDSDRLLSTKGLCSGFVGCKSNRLLSWSSKYFSMKAFKSLMYYQKPTWLVWDGSTCRRLHTSIWRRLLWSSWSCWAARSSRAPVLSSSDCDVKNGSCLINRTDRYSRQLHSTSRQLCKQASYLRRPHAHKTSTLLRTYVWRQPWLPN